MTTKEMTREELENRFEKSATQYCAKKGNSGLCELFALFGCKDGVALFTESEKEKALAHLCEAVESLTDEQKELAEKAIRCIKETMKAA